MLHEAAIVLAIYALGVIFVKYVIIRPLQQQQRKPPVSTLDDCELCLGHRGGVKGNENIFPPPWGGRKLKVCDYCHADLLQGKIPGGWPPIPNPLPPPPPPPPAPWQV